MTATLDHARRRLRVTEAEVAALCTVSSSQVAAPDGRAAWERLERSQVVVGEQLPGWVAEIGSVLAAPGLHVVVERHGTEAVVIDQLWATPDHAVIAEAADAGHVELSPLQTALIPYELARLVGLALRPEPPSLHPVTVPAAALTAAEEAVGSGDLDGARQALTDVGVADGDADTVADLLAGRRLSWRITSVWRSSPDDVVASMLVVVDGGAAGLWLSDAADIGDLRTTVTLSPTRPNEVWKRLLGLLPASTATGEPHG
jgi:hypothetical protein